MTAPEMIDETLKSIAVSPNLCSSMLIASNRPIAAHSRSKCRAGRTSWEETVAGRGVLVKKPDLLHSSSWASFELQLLDGCVTRVRSDENASWTYRVASTSTKLGLPSLSPVSNGGLA
jgi:hypothetical protein